MPKVVDHEQRRHELSEAVWAVVATRGLAAVSLREVAAEAGVSMGTVQHYFGTREHMVRFACRRLVDLAGEGLASLVRQAPQAARVSPREVIRLVGVQTLPATDAERAGAGVWQAFVTHALLDPGVAAVVREAWEGARRLVAGELERARAGGQLREGVEPVPSANGVLVLLDGLVPRLVLGDLAPREALQIVDDHLDRLFLSATAR